MIRVSARAVVLCAQLASGSQLKYNGECKSRFAIGKFVGIDYRIRGEIIIASYNRNLVISTRYEITGLNYSQLVITWPGL